jgi:solute carrier family 25 protein 39/40
VHSSIKAGFTPMSGRWDRHADSDKEIATTFEHRNFEGKGHDRIHGDNPIPGVSSTIAMTGDNNDIEVDITAGQKMLSAMSGSLLTSLLGQKFSSRKRMIECVY